MKLLAEKILKNRVSLLTILLLLICSFMLMWSTLSHSDGYIKISPHLFGDYSTHLSLIRSFSKGYNPTPEYQGFPGEYIKYHYFFFYLAGMLERIGFRIDIALALLGGIGLTGVLTAVFLLAKKVFGTIRSGIIASLLCLANSSLSWVYFLQGKHSASDVLNALISSPTFASSGPFDGKLVSICWNLNVFVNQRHLLFALMLYFVFVYCIHYTKSKKMFAVGMGAFFVISLMHKSILIIALVSVFCLAVAAPHENRKRLLLACAVTCLLTIPSVMLSRNVSTIIFRPGFLFNETTEWDRLHISSPILRWVVYWAFNCGFTFLLACVSWLSLRPESKSKFEKVKEIFFSDKTVWATIAILVFVLGNLFAFGREMFGANHKFFNFSLLIANVYVGGFLDSLPWKGIINKSIITGIFLLLTLGGIVDISPVFAPRKMSIPDITKDPVSEWVLTKTPRDAVFFNITDDVLPITLAGRKVFYGWEYISWSYGYDVDSRKEEIRSFLDTNTTFVRQCAILRDHAITYIAATVDQSSFAGFPIDRGMLYARFTRINDELPFFEMFDVQTSCYGVF